MTVGNPALWSDIFPEDLIPQILDLVWSTWATFVMPGPDEHEVPITQRFKRDLQQAKNFRRLPIRIEREVAEDDPTTADELGRIDLKLAPAESALEEVYFAFECKRLYAMVNGKWSALASRYVDEGMTRFVTGQYSSCVSHGGMIAYVLNGDTKKAKKQVEINIGDRWQTLRMKNPAKLSPSSVATGIDDICETKHHRDSDGDFRLHHVFLPRVTAPPPSPPAPSAGNAKPVHKKK